MPYHLCFLTANNLSLGNHARGCICAAVIQRAGFSRTHLCYLRSLTRRPAARHTRYLLRVTVMGWMTARFPKWAAVDAALSAEGWKLITLLRLSPIVPWNVLNYALSVTGFHNPPWGFACRPRCPGTCSSTRCPSLVTQSPFWLCLLPCAHRIGMPVLLLRPAACCALEFPSACAVRCSCTPFSRVSLFRQVAKCSCPWVGSACCHAHMFLGERCHPSSCVDLTMFDRGAHLRMNRTKCMRCCMIAGVGLVPYTLSSALAIVPWCVTFTYFGTAAKSMADILDGRAGPDSVCSVVPM